MPECRRVTPEEIRKGYIVCDCGKYAYVTAARVIAMLPPGYYGETCLECGARMVSLKVLEKALEEMSNEPTQES